MVQVLSLYNQAKTKSLAPWEWERSPVLGSRLLRNSSIPSLQLLDMLTVGHQWAKHSCKFRISVGEPAKRPVQQRYTASGVSQAAAVQASPYLERSRGVQRREGKRDWQWQKGTTHHPVTAGISTWLLDCYATSSTLCQPPRPVGTSTWALVGVFCVSSWKVPSQPSLNGSLCLNPGPSALLTPALSALNPSPRPHPTPRHPAPPEQSHRCNLNIHTCTNVPF